MNFVGVPLVHALGYAPGWVGIGEDLPKGVFLQWADWVSSPRYLFDSKLPALENFAKFKGELRALCFSDDPWATRPAVELLASGFTAIKPEVLHRETIRRRRQGDRPFRLLPPRTPRHACGAAWRNGSRGSEGCLRTLSQRRLQAT